MKRTAFIITFAFAAGFLLGISVPQAEAKRESDTQKWERLEKHRSMRRETEQKYQACLRGCLP